MGRDLPGKCAEIKGVGVGPHEVGHAQRRQTRVRGEFGLSDGMIPFALGNERPAGVRVVIFGGNRLRSDPGPTLLIDLNQVNPHDCRLPTVLPPIVSANSVQSESCGRLLHCRHRM